MVLEQALLPDCEQCSGTGRLIRNCTKCNPFTGMTTVRCTQCEGRRTIPDRRRVCPRCCGMGIMFTLCWRCGGCRWVFDRWCGCYIGRLREQERETICP